MPMSARTSIRSCSVMFSMCRPLTRMLPESGRSNPRISLSTTDFPAPLGPSRIRMLPLGTLKLTLRRMTWSSKAKETRSKTTADSTGSTRTVGAPTGNGVRTGASIERSSIVGRLTAVWKCSICRMQEQPACRAWSVAVRSLSSVFWLKTTAAQRTRPRPCGEFSAVAAGILQSQ